MGAIGMYGVYLSDGRGPLRRAQRAVLRMHMRGTFRSAIMSPNSLRVREPLGVVGDQSPKERVWTNG